MKQPQHNELILYDAKHAISTNCGRVITFNAAWSSQLKEVYPLVGVEFAPDPTNSKRWIVRNGDGTIFVQHPTFGSPVIEIQPGGSIGIVDGSRIATSPHARWINVSIA